MISHIPYSVMLRFMVQLGKIVHCTCSPWRNSSYLRSPNVWSYCLIFNMGVARRHGPLKHTNKQEQKKKMGWLRADGISHLSKCIVCKLYFNWISRTSRNTGSPWTSWDSTCMLSHIRLLLCSTVSSKLISDNPLHVWWFTSSFN